MPYIDATGVHTGWSDMPQPAFNYTTWADEPPAMSTPVPQLVSRFQGREAMWRTPHGDASLYEAAQAFINAPDTAATYKRAWADLQEFRRGSEMLLAMAASLNLSDAALDDLFILAGSIQA